MVAFDQFTESARFTDTGARFTQRGDIEGTGYGGPVEIVFEAGVEYALEGGVDLRFGNARVSAEGTENNRVVFSGPRCPYPQDSYLCEDFYLYSGGAGSIYGGSGEADSFVFTTFDGLGWTYDGRYEDYPYPAVTLTASEPTRLSHVEIINSSTLSLDIAGAGLSEDSEELTAHTIAARDCVAGFSLPAGTVASNVTLDCSSIQELAMGFRTW